MTHPMKHVLMLAALLLTAPCTAGAAKAPADDLVLKNGRVELTFSGGDTFLFKSYRSEGAEMLPEGGQCDPSLAPDLPQHGGRESDPAAPKRLLRGCGAARYVGSGSPALYLARCP